MQHRCLPGCCAHPSDIIEKMRVWVPCLVQALSRELLNRTDWRSWQVGCYLLGFLECVHGLFDRALSRTFAGIEANVEAAENDGQGVSGPRRLSDRSGWSCNYTDQSAGVIPSLWGGGV